MQKIEILFPRPVTFLAFTLGLVFAGIAMTIAAAPAQATHRGGPHGPQTLGNLNCSTDQIAKFDGTDWVCEALPVDTFLSNQDVNDIVGTTLESLDCPAESFVRKDAAGDWQCLSLAELRSALGLASTVFTTSGAYTGDLVTEANSLLNPTPLFTVDQGLPAGDALCNFHAASAGLAGDYVAWLSDSNTDAKSRLTPGSGPFVTTNGDLVATDIADLTDATLANPIDYDETGAGPISAAGPAEELVWTGTNEFGMRSFLNCNDWSSSNNPSGSFGQSGQKDFDWTNRFETFCNETAWLYCFIR